MIYVPDDGDSVEFWSLPVRIRELIKHLWETNPEICSPSGSTSDPYDSNDQIGQVSLAEQKVPDDSEDRESLEAEKRAGNQVESENENSADNEWQNLLNLSLPEQNVPENATAAPETSERQREGKGKAFAYEDSESSENPAERQLVVCKGNNTPAEIKAATVSDYDTSRTISDRPTESRNLNRRRHKVNVNESSKNERNLEKKTKNVKEQSFRFLSDINAQLIDERLETPFPESRKRKAKKINHTNTNKTNKKHDAIKANESPRLDEAGLSNHGAANCEGSGEPCDSGLVLGRGTMSKPLNHGLANREGSSWSGLVVRRARSARPFKHGPRRLNSNNVIDDPRVKEAAGGLLWLSEEILKAGRCKGLGQCRADDECEPSHSRLVVVRADDATGLRDEMEVAQDKESEGEDSECMLNENAADFSTAKRFTRRR